jgi:hypothetical protein
MAVIHETPEMTLCDITRSHTCALEAVLWGTLPVKEKIKEEIHRSRGFQQALEGLMVKHEQATAEP